MYLGLAAALAAWYNVIRHYTGPERSGVAIFPGGGHVQRTWHNVVCIVKIASA